MGKRNYFTGYRILLYELPVVAVLFTQSNNIEGTMKNSILVHVLDLQNLVVVKYGINLVK